MAAPSEMPMELQVNVNGRVRTVRIEPRDGLFRVTVDGETRLIDAAAIDDTTFSLVGIDHGHRSEEVGLGEIGQSGELAVHLSGGVVVARVSSGPGRFGRGAGGTPQTAGRQQVVAPMPGKVVKVLVKEGDSVRVRQGLVVVEAMKMENELRSPKDGRVARVLVDEGTLVESGRPLVEVE
ncbi:MAG: biotin/lipoyl-containing protein [Acidobacteriota bacterium]|mgnify:CR=1 FL=1